MKKTSLPRRCSFGSTKYAAFLLIGLAGALALLPESRAQTTYTWDTQTISDGVTRTWSTAANWNPDGAPVPGAVQIDFSGLTANTSLLTIQNDIVGTWDISKMTLANATIGITYSKVGGAVMNWVQDGSSNNPQLIHNAGTASQTINFSSVIGSGVTLQVTGSSASNLSWGGAISGAGGVNVNKSAGTLVAAAAQTYTGDFTLTQGEIALGVDTAGTPGAVTSGPLGRGTIVFNGGVLRATSGGQRTLGNNVQIGGNFQVGNASNNSITFAGTTLLSGTGSTRTITGGFSGTSNATTNTLTFSGNITDGGGGNGITFANSSVTKVVLSGVNTYTGNTTVTGGNLTLSDNAELKFAIGANGVNNQLTGNGTVTLNGDFTFDLSGAGTTLGNSWTIVNVGSLTETFGATFSVVGFSDLGGNLWEKVNGGTTYQFSEATGILSVTAVPEPATWALLAAGLTVSVVFRRRRSA